MALVKALHGKFSLSRNDTIQLEFNSPLFDFSTKKQNFYYSNIFVSSGYRPSGFHKNNIISIGESQKSVLVKKKISQKN
jgi:hypothetical protein